MTDDRSPWSSVVLAPAAELIVGWRPGRSRLDGAAIELSTQVAAELRALCVTTVEHLASMTRRAYGGSPYIEPDEEYLAVPATQLPRTAVVSPGLPDDNDATSLSDLQRLVVTTGLPTLSREELRAGRYLFYAVICTAEGSRQRIGFVRQADPHRVAKTGGLMTLLGQEGLQHLEDPVFVFDARFDLIVGPDETAVLRLETFNRMFADLNTLAAAAPLNAKQISAAVHQMTPAAIEALGRAAAARPTLARRLQRLTRPGAAPDITPSDLSTAMTKHGLNPDDVITSNEITFTDDKAALFLDLLEQIYYETDFTREHRRSDRYSPLKR